MPPKATVETEIGQGKDRKTARKTGGKTRETEADSVPTRESPQDNVNFDKKCENNDKRAIYQFFWLLILQACLSRQVLWVTRRYS
jgi:hypothetical protein